MTPEELQEVVAAVIAALKTNGKTIDQLTAVTALANSDNLEVSGGKKISFGKLKEIVAADVTVSAEEIKGYVVIESTDDLPEDPTQEEQMKGYILDTMLYIYVGTGGDTLDGKYRSIQLKGEDGAPGAPGPQGPKGDSGVHLGDVKLVNNLTEGGEGSALTAEMGKTLKGMIDSKTFPIVNDLTTGGEESALSAEMGKMIGETLELDSSSEVVTERIPYGQHYGYIVANGINVGGDNYFRYSDPIYLKAGESLKIKANTPTTIGRLASYNPTTQSYVRLEKGTSASTSASEVYENTYTAENDIYIVVGWQCQNYGIELTKTYTKTATTSKIDVVDAMSDTLEMTTSTETTTSPVVLTTKVGAYAGVTDNKVTIFRSDYSNYRASEDFYLEQGDTIEITANNVPNTVEVLVALDGTLYRAIVRGNGGNLTTTYTAPIDGYFAVSWNPTYGITVIKTSTKATSESERISTIEESTTQIPALVSSVGDLEDAVYNTVTDNFTEGIVDGEFINAGGGINDNSDFFHKEFELKAGVEITFTARGHTNCAPISKKIRNGVYQVLATPTSGTHTWTYTTTERCVIALSAYKGSPSATFFTQEINTNTIDIDNIYDILGAHDHKFKTPDYGLLFDKVAVIGDSLTVGTLDAVSGDDAHAAGGSFGCSWLTYLAKRWGSAIRMHYGVGGSTCYSWLGSNQYGLGLMLKDSVVYDAYFIAYGHNDAGRFTIGTTSDTPTSVVVDENNDVTMEMAAADTTFLGNYKKIVNEIRTKAPNALIFMLCTDAKDSSTAGTIGYMNQYIEELAEWYYEQGDHKVFYLDYISMYVEKVGYKNGGHWSTFGYANIGRLINDAVNNVIEAYLDTNALKVWGNYLDSYRTTKNDQTRSGGYLPHL